MVPEPVVKTPAERLARALSLLLSPYTVTAVTAALVTLRYASPGLRGVLQAVLGIGACAVVPFVFTLWMVRTGRATDIHAAVRQQRHPMFFVAICSTGIATLLLRATDAAPVVVAMGIAYCVSGAVFWTITAVWKISLHSGVLAGSLVIGAFAFGDGAVYAAPLLPLVGWARLVRGRHTLAQVVAGALCGSIVTFLVLRRYAT